MDPEPASVSSPTTHIETSSRSFSMEVVPGLAEEDPFSLSGTSIALFGLTMALAVVGVPLVAVVTDRPLGRESFAPTAFQSDGSESSLPISFSRLGESCCRDSSRK